MLKYIPLILALGVSGCSGKIYTVKVTDTSYDAEAQGVPFYGYKPVTKKVVLDRIRHPKTQNITHSMYEDSSSEQYCSPQIKLIESVVADFSTRYIIKYKPGLFESNKFAVVLENGMLKSVNSESTPAPAAAAEALQGLVDVREDVLNGIAKEASSDQKANLSNIQGESPKKSPIACSAST